MTKEQESTFLVTHLPDDVLKRCLLFVGPGSNLFGLIMHYPFPKTTLRENAMASLECAKFYHQELANGINGAHDDEQKKRTAAAALVAYMAASQGKVKVIEWAFGGYKLSERVKEIVCWKAAAAGHTEILEWLSKTGYKGVFSGITCCEAAKCGHVHVLEWLHSFHSVSKHSIAIAECAVEHGHVSVLQWMNHRDLLTRVDNQAILWKLAAVAGHIHVLECLKYYTLIDDQSVLAVAWVYAACASRIHVLNWLFGSGFGNSMNVLALTPIRNVEVLEWANDHGVEWEHKSCEIAARLAF